MKECECTEYERKRYISKLSGPILDRIDIFSFVNAVSYDEIKNKKNKQEKSVDIRKRVKYARDIQNFRYKNEKIHCNAQLTQKLINKYCKLDKESNELIDRVYSIYNISVRCYTRILKVARTIADLNDHNKISKTDIMEAVQYRKYLDNKII